MKVRLLVELSQSDRVAGNIKFIILSVDTDFLLILAC